RDWSSDVCSSDLGEHGSGAPWRAYALPVVAMLALVAATLLERASKRTTPLPDAMAAQCLISLVLFSVLAVATGTAAPPASSSFWAAVALTVVVSHLGGCGSYWLCLRARSVGRASGVPF